MVLEKSIKLMLAEEPANSSEYNVILSISFMDSSIPLLSFFLIISFIQSSHCDSSRHLSDSTPW